MSELKFVWTCLCISYRHICVEVAINVVLGSSVKSPVVFIFQEGSIFICKVEQ